MENISSPEIIVLSVRECFVYKIPPLRTASGHRSFIFYVTTFSNILRLSLNFRAEDWKLETPLFTGCLKIFQADSKVYNPINCFDYCKMESIILSESTIASYCGLLTQRRKECDIR